MLPTLDLETFNHIRNNNNFSFVLEKRTEEELKDQNYSKDLILIPYLSLNNWQAGSILSKSLIIVISVSSSLINFFPYIDLYYQINAIHNLLRIPLNTLFLNFSIF